MQMTQTILLHGGLDLISPQIAMPPGRAIAALNYEPDVNGYTSTGGYERFDGRTSPSSGADAAAITALRALIAKVPGSGPVRGVCVYQGAVLAFRDTVSSTGAMYKSTPSGWVQQTFGHTLDFQGGVTEFTEDTTVTGGTSGVTGRIKRVIVTSGAWDGSAAGYMVLSGVTNGLAANMVTNGTFDSDTGWTKGTGVTIAAGVGTFTAVANGVLGLSQSASITLTAGVTYRFTFTISGYSAGGVRARFGGGTEVLGTLRQANGTFTEDLVAVTGNVSVGLQAVGTTTLNVDNVTVQRVNTDFAASETITASPGSATGNGPQVAISLPAGGVYAFKENNFYGAATASRLYFVNGVGTAFEWDGTVLAPIRTGTDTSSDTDVLLTAGGPPDRVLTADGDQIIVAEVSVDNPAFIGIYRNHLFLGYALGAVVFSAPGLPLEYRSTLGAGTFSFGSALTGMLLASTALVLFGRNRVEYIAGNDVDDFLKLEVSDASGAVLGTPQVAGESPIYMDDAGLRRLSASAAYGDFKMGTLTQLVEPLVRKKRLAGIVPNCSLIVKGKDQYRLYYDDGAGLVLYMGREYPETLPFKLPATFSCTAAGEITPGQGDRLFAGGTDGYVYELDKGTSFDGAAIETYIRFAFNTLQSATQKKAFHKFTCDVVCEDAITVGVKFDIDYSRAPERGGEADSEAVAGTPTVSTDDFADIDWTQAVQGEFSRYLYGIGRNIAVTLITSSSTKAQHTFPSSTLNFTPRGLVR